MSKNKLSPEAQAIISAADAGLHLTTIALVEKFLIEHPESQRAWLDLGQAHAELGRYEEAEKAFLKVIELSEDRSEGAVFGEIGNLYRARGEFNSAISWYQKQVDADPEDATGLLYLGNLLMRQGKFEAAESAFQTALQCEQVCLEETHFALGLVNRSIHRLQDAKTHFEKVLEYDQKFAEAKVALKDVKTALASLEQ